MTSCRSFPSERTPAGGNFVCSNAARASASDAMFGRMSPSTGRSSARFTSAGSVDAVRMNTEAPSDWIRKHMFSSSGHVKAECWTSMITKS